MDPSTTYLGLKPGRCSGRGMFLQLKETEQ